LRARRRRADRAARACGAVPRWREADRSAEARRRRLDPACLRRGLARSGACHMTGTARLTYLFVGPGVDHEPEPWQRAAYSHACGGLFSSVHNQSDPVLLADERGSRCDWRAAICLAVGIPVDKINPADGCGEL